METLLDKLKVQFPDSSRRTLQNWIKAKRVFLNGEVCLKPQTPVDEEASIELGKKGPQVLEGIPILYQDKWFIVIDKPSGLLSVPAENDQPSALSLLRRHFSLYPVHRIDQETSGALLIARNPKAEEAFDALFEAHDLTREYLAIVDGYVPGEGGTWENYLRELPNYDMEVTTPDQGKQAITHYEVLHRSKKFSYLKLRLETGRKHQIRVQCQEAGFPVLGDKRYGSLSNPFKRLALHALSLSFQHPFTGKEMTFFSPPPRSFNLPPSIGY